MISESDQIESIDRLLYLYSERNAEKPDTIEFWKRSIRAFCLRNSRFTFSEEELFKASIKHGVTPTSLHKSLAFIRAHSKDVEESSKFQGNTDFTSTIFNFAKSMLGSKEDVLASVTLLNEARVALQQHLKNLEDHDCLKLLKLESPGDEEFTFSGLLKAIAASNYQGSINSFLGGIDEKNVSLLINHLVNENVAIFSEDYKYVKLSKVEPQPATSMLNLFLFVSKSADAGELEIKESDICRLQLKMSIAHLERKVRVAEEKIAALHRKAVEYKRQNDTKQALFQLSLKKSATAFRDQLLKALHSLMETHEKIDEARTNAVVLGAYKAATAGLRATRKEQQLSVEQVEETMEEYQQEMDEMTDIATVIQERSQDMMHAGPNALTAEDELALELELETLMLEQMQINDLKSHAELINSLPVASSHAVSVSTGDAETRKVVDKQAVVG